MIFAHSRRTVATLALLATGIAAALPANADRKRNRDMSREEKRESIDSMAAESLDELLGESEKAKTLYSKAVGYAVFDNLKLSLMISGGGGQGVAVNKKTGDRVYMKMGTAGLNIGLGGQRYQVVFLFQDEKTLQTFVDKGWQADASANAVAWKQGANAEATFTNGVAVFQMTEKGLMLQADIAGTKYWKNKKLNKD
jgi:lipid-binding SYLF domain-containing protein